MGEAVMLPARGLLSNRVAGYLRVGPLGQRRVPVYWLGEPHWDCYYEDELLPIESLPF
jgi:hypothetical protein